jgi:hypothetical protein
MLQSRVLHSPADLLRYETLYAHKSGVPLDADYLRDSLVRVFFRPGEIAPDGGERWRAGYIQHRNGQQRYLAGLDAPDRQRLLATHHLSPRDWVEITGLFIEAHATGYLGRLQVYLTLIGEALRSGKSVVLGGAVRPRYQRDQRRVLPHLLYEGQVFLGNDVHPLQVYYARRYEVPFTLAWALLDDVTGYLRRRMGYRR